MRTLFLSAMLAVGWCGFVFGQDSAPSQSGGTSLQAELDHLSAAADTLHKRLPSFQCKEFIVSKELKRNGALRYRTELQADLRVRKVPDGSVHEEYSIVTINGKPFTGAGIHLPVYVEGGFRLATTYFESRYRSCFRYALRPGRLDFAAETLGKPECYEVEGVNGFATLNDAGDMTHLERHAQGDAALRHNRVPFAAIDLQPVTLDGDVYRLSSHLVAEIYSKKLIQRFEADYINCRLFAATVTIKGEGSKIVGPE